MAVVTDMLHTTGLTVGQVSGIIAAAIVIVKFLIPNIFALLLVGSLRERDQTFTTSAVSWSVIGKQLHSSLWPTILQTDSAASSGVMTSVNISKWISLFTTILIAITAIVTPLGLYEQVVADSHTTLQTFHYIADKSFFGAGTQPRNSSVGWSRICGAFDPAACPHSDTNITTFRNATGGYYDVNGNYDTYVPQKTVDLFQSGVGALGDSVSGPFDIQWRSTAWALENVNMTFNNTNAYNLPTYAVGAFRTISSLALNDRLEVIEGLIVDTVNGGVGFRNHTAPPVTAYGSSWKEDILFIEPVSTCVDTNLTLDFTVPTNNGPGTQFGSDYMNLRLVDHGGFVNFDKDHYPEYDRNDTQKNPDFWTRAYKGAFLNNMWSMGFMNVTNLHNPDDPNSPHAFKYLNSTMGKEFPFVYSDGRPTSTFMTITPHKMSSSSYGYYLDFLEQPVAPTNLTYSNTTVSGEPALYPNPANVTSDDWSDVSLLCEGAGGQDFANITNFAAVCSLILAMPRRKDGVDDLMAYPGSDWTIPMYSCISASRAIIKTVTFNFNATDDLSGLSVTHIEPKTYAKEEDKPLWGVEYTESPIADIQPLWGIVSPEAAKGDVNLTTLRANHLWLPGDGGLGSLGATSYQNLPAIDIPVDSIAAAQNNLGSTGTVMIDYSGSTNLAMFRRWQNLSSKAETTGKILDLIATDLLANAVVGTKSLAPSSAGSKSKRDSTGNPIQVPVTQYRNRIKYHMVYAIPAIITLVLLATSLALSCFAIIFRQTGPAKMKRYLNATSAGRIMTERAAATSGSDSLSTSKSSTKEWADTHGRKRIMAGNGRSVPVDSLGYGESGDLLKISADPKDAS
ncbi:hypothetical protein BT63DRAFT_52662 [Microthyrium microscopicum]|uniref:Uncharacterized protein n=1 Tax=Microthyrium microscopicum TaxID=703497 RepID=A0A6A6U2R3_9PEZI|nr:hypothetical protein BT63DRAFT_52662 [Microthyrium microscopicum]